MHPLAQGKPPQTLHFVLDTGSFLTILDTSVPSSLFEEAAFPISFRDSVGANLRAESVLLKRLEIAGVVRDSVAALRMDLRSTMMGRCQDQPVEGVLGMNVLRGMRFTFDPMRKRVEWWPAPSPGAINLPVIYHPDGRPGIVLKYGKDEIPCLIDTGGMGGIDLPSRLQPKDAGTTVHATGLAGPTTANGTVVDHQSIQAGPFAWNDIPVFFQEGDEDGMVGMDVWSSRPVCFDFLTNTVSWNIDPRQGLPIRRPGRRGLPILWDRSGPTPVLKVVEIMPGSDMERAGCKTGDQILRVGTLKGKTLTRGCLLEWMAKRTPHSWTIKRDGIEVELFFSFDDTARKSINGTTEP